MTESPTFDDPEGEPAPVSDLRWDSPTHVSDMRADRARTKEVAGRESRRPADEYERLAADARLLSLARADTRALRRLQERLVAYAIPVVVSMIRSRKMWSEARRVGFTAPAPPSSIEPHEILSLAGEVVVRAWNRFEKHGLYKWSPDGGVALTTWFIDDCKYQFAPAVRRWEQDRRGLLRDGYPCDLGFDFNELDDSVEVGQDDATASLAIGNIDLARRLDEIELRWGRNALEIVKGRAIAGRTLAEIGRELNMPRQKVHRIYTDIMRELQRTWQGD